ncbi:hypothetical protein EC991_001062 [Linnemannia zychae]|nr:hypothetical protein EC991_001062 [Linnemannia zychae]
MGDIIPLEAISRNSHLLKVIQLRSYDFPPLASALLGCSNLIELDIEFCDGRSLNEKTGLTESHLLKSNSLLRRLRLVGNTLDDQRLNLQDFVGFKNLESLYLYYWDCSNGRLGGILKAVSMTLREFTLDNVSGLEPGDISSVLLQDDAKSHSKDTRTVNTEQAVLRLRRLEKLDWRCERTVLDCAAELVKFCPNLKVFTLPLFRRGSLDGLAESFRSHCPHLENVTIWESYKSEPFTTFFQRCSLSGLRIVKFESCVRLGDLVPGALHHASTLEDLQFYWDYDGAVGSTYLRLPVECTKLRRFAFTACVDVLKTNPLEALKQEKWGCRDLEELDLHLHFLTDGPFTEESEQEFRDMTSAAGWEMVPLSYRYHEFKATHLPKVFELLSFQELEKLQRLVLSDIPFRRIVPRTKHTEQKNGTH